MNIENRKEQVRKELREEVRDMKSTTTCKDCGREVKEEENFCSFCGASNPQGWNFTKIMSWVILAASGLFILFITLPLIFGTNSDSDREIKKKLEERDLSSVNKQNIELLIKDEYQSLEVRQIEIKKHRSGTGNVIHVHVRSVTSWDTESMVDNAADDSFVVSKALYQNYTPKQVSEVKVTHYATFTDKYGNNSVEKAIRISLQGDKVERINWDGLEDRIISYPKHWLKIAEAEYIHPAIVKKLREQGVSLPK
jgi:hypothetical protein